MVRLIFLFITHRSKHAAVRNVETGLLVAVAEETEKGEIPSLGAMWQESEPTPRQAHHEDAVTMTLDDLVKETLTEKNRRLRQEKCGHEEVVCSSVTSPVATYENRFCMDCGKSWRLVDGESALSTD